MKKAELKKYFEDHQSGYVGTIIQKNGLTGRGNITTRLEKDSDQIKAKSPQDRGYTWFTIEEAAKAFKGKKIHNL